jgi:NADH-quinone oxidoreductase subunit C
MSLPDGVRNHPLVGKLLALDPPGVSDACEFRGELTLWVPAPRIRTVSELLKNEPGLNFNFLADLTAVDRFPVEPRFEVVYHLLSLPRGERVRLKVRLPGDGPQVESLTGLWPAAQMLEREVFDLFGIRFRGHPHLRRLLLPDDWEGHPLRKDYPVEGPR